MIACYCEYKISGIYKFVLQLTEADIEVYKRAETSKLSPEVCDLLDAIIEEAVKLKNTLNIENRQ